MSSRRPAAGKQGPTSEDDEGLQGESSPFDTTEARAAAPDTVVGERGIPLAKTFQSLQSRVSTLLTVSLMVALAAGLLIWYYSGAIGRSTQARRAAVTEQQRRAQGDSALPPLSGFQMPRPARQPPGSDSESRVEGSQPSTLERVLGGPPELPNNVPPLTSGLGSPYGPSTNATPHKTLRQLAVERQLSGPVLTRAVGQEPVATPAFGAAGSTLPTTNVLPTHLMSSGSAPPNGPAQSELGTRTPNTLEALLQVTPTPAVSARVLPTRRYLLPKGAFIDCTLETAINSSLPGMTTCITATDTFSADGSVVLLERGTKLVGETKGTVQAGTPRLFVLWNEARTPAGIVVPLESPGTDELGRAGFSGSVDWHWWQRFGAAILVSVIDGAVETIATRANSTSVQVNPAGASDVMTEVLRGTLAIPPTIFKPQGDRVEILVARDVDFRSVYALHEKVAAGLPDWSFE